MTSDDNLRRPLLDPFESRDASYVKYTEPSSTAVEMNLAPVLPSTRSTLKRKGRKTKNSHSNRVSTGDRSTISLSKRLSARKLLQNRLSTLTDIMCYISIVSIILMVIENEIKFRQINERETSVCWWIKLMITILTVALVCLVFTYHRLDLALFAVKNAVEDWRIGLTNKKILLVLIEAVICAIHPIPLTYPNDARVDSEQLVHNATDDIQPASIPVDIALGLPMFARLYLLFRAMMYHSDLFRKSSCQSIGYLNQVSIDFSFLMKTCLERWPTRCLIALSICTCVIGSWSLRACDHAPDNGHLSVPDAMWIFALTYTTLGYADIYPTTYCSRTVAMLICLLGLLAMSILISVLSQKLVFKRSENYLHTFVVHSELANEHTEEAANVIKYAIKLWVQKRNHSVLSSFQCLKTQRKLFEAINTFKEIKQEEKNLVDACIGPIELINMQRKTQDTTAVTNKKIESMETKVNRIEEQFININNAIGGLQQTLNILTNKFTEDANV